MRNALRHTTPWALARLSARAAADTLGGLLGRAPLLVPLAGPRGTVASLTTPDSLNGAHALNPANKYPHWQQNVAARSAIRVGFYRPARFAAQIRCPLLVLAYDQDGVAPPAPAIRAAQSAPRGQVSCLSGGHYAAFLDGEDKPPVSWCRSSTRALAPRADGPADDYVAGGEPGVVIAPDVGGR